MNDNPVDLDKHRGMAAQKATDIRRALADVEVNARLLRDRQGVLEIQLLAVPAASWAEAVAKARYVLNFYSAGLPPEIPIIATSSPRSSRILPGSPAGRPDQNM